MEWRKDLFYLLLPEALSIRYQPSCQKCSTLLPLLCFWPPRFYFSAGNRWHSSGNAFPWYNQNRCRYLR